LHAIENPSRPDALSDEKIVSQVPAALITTKMPGLAPGIFICVNSDLRQKTGPISGS
jgi:hypothetical protein